MCLLTYTGANAQLDSVTVSPNPFKDTITVSCYLSDSSNVSFTVYEITGKLVLDTTIGKTIGEIETVLVVNGSQGLYLLSVTSDEGNKRLKLVKYRWSGVLDLLEQHVVIKGRSNEIIITGIEEGMVQVFSLNGNLINQQQISSNQTTISVKVIGMVIVTIKTEGGNISKKINLSEF